MSRATSPDDRAVGAAERLHPLFLLTGLGGSLRGLTGAYAAIAYLLVSGRLQTALWGAAAMLVLTVAGVALHWLKFAYRVGESEIRIDSGIFSRRHRSIPFDRIHDVDITQGPLARLLGLAKVRFETGGGGGSDGDEGVLHTITLVRAEEIRGHIRARRKPEQAGAEAIPAEAEQKAPVYAMGGRRLLLAGLFNFSLAVFAGLFGVTQTFGDVLGFDPLSRAFWTGLLDPGHPVAEFVLSHRIAAAFAGAVLLVLVGLLTGVVRTVTRDFGFRLDSTDGGLRRRRGLLTRTDVTLPVRRAQAVTVGTGPVRDQFGWAELTMQSLAREEGGKADHVLAPLASGAEVDTILVELGWRPLGDRVAWLRVSPAYVTSFALALLPLAAIALGEVLVMPTIGLAGLAVLFLLLAVRLLGWRRTAYALDGERVLVRTGWWRRQLTILPLDRIQSIDFTQNFVTRRLGIATLRFGVAGGGIRGHVIPALPSEEARQLRRSLLGMAA